MRRLTNAELFAVVVSAVSLIISVLGNRTQERLLSASVWPFLSFTSGNTSDDGQQKIIAITIENSGNGPARIRRFGLEYDHRDFTSAGTLLEKCCDFHPPNVMTSPVAGRVLRPGEQITFLQVAPTPETAEGWQRLDRARFGFVYSACYCSTLDECWDVRSDRADPVAVATCGETPRDRQWHG
jgi:hypothetical protein